MDEPDSPDKQNFNKLKKTHGKSESINYTLLNEKRIHDDEKKGHIFCWINNTAYHNLTLLVSNKQCLDGPVSPGEYNSY